MHFALLTCVVLMSVLGCSSVLDPNPAPSTPAPRGGTDIGAGGDDLLCNESVAWFSGNGNTVRFCSDISPEFGLSKEEIHTLSRQALNTWSHYLKKRSHLLGPKMSHVFVYQPSCLGSEQVKLHFGTSTPDIERFKKSFTKPIAFTLKYSSSTSTHIGSAWFTPHSPEGFPNYKKDDGAQLLGILLHEIGHMLGVSHSAGGGTIMSAQIAHFMRSLDKKKLSQIDVFRELIHDPNQCEVFRSKQLMDVGIARLISGRIFPGPVSVTVIRRPNHSVLWDTAPTHRIILSHPSGSETIGWVAGMNFSYSIGPGVFEVNSTRWVGKNEMPVYHQELPYFGSNNVAVFKYGLLAPLPEASTMTMNLVTEGVSHAEVFHFERLPSHPLCDER